jgi:hypothetical protein
MLILLAHTSYLSSSFVTILYPLPSFSSFIYLVLILPIILLLHPIPLPSPFLSLSSIIPILALPLFLLFTAHFHGSPSVRTLKVPAHDLVQLPVTQHQRLELETARAQQVDRFLVLVRKPKVVTVLMYLTR